VVEALPSIDRKLVWHNGELSPLGYQSFLGHFPDDGLTFAVLANVDSTGFGLTPIVFGALADRPPPADPEGRSKRLHVTARVLHLGPAMALLLFAGLYAVTRWRPASWAKTLASASATFMLAVVVLGLFTPKWIFVGGTAATAVASVALVVAARSRSSRKMDTVVAGLMTVFALTGAALALGIRLILMSR
jgi:hypothetical protein